jgi:hypothetical protein
MSPIFDFLEWEREEKERTEIMEDVVVYVFVGVVGEGWIREEISVLRNANCRFGRCGEV